MLKHIKLIGIALLTAALFGAAAQASCDGCKAKNGMILFSNETAEPGSEVFLAWNFKGVPDVDYAKVIVDEDYAHKIFDADGNFEKITNYLTDSEGKVLAEIADIDPKTPYGGIFGGAGLSPNHRGSQFGEDAKAGFVYFGMDTRWYTASVLFFKKTGTGPTLALTPIQGVGVEQFDKAYRGFLDKNFGKKANYKRDKGELATNYVVGKSAVDCKAKGADYCFSVEATAEVPKAPHDNSFLDDSIFQVGIKLDGSNGKLKVFSVKPSPQN